jgi:RNA polymerase-interacting CarD/CdnL/TRCF family regulator
VELERKHQDKINSSGVSQISEIIKSVVRQKSNKGGRTSAQFGASNSILTPRGL